MGWSNANAVVLCPDMPGLSLGWVWGETSLLCWTKITK